MKTAEPEIRNTNEGVRPENKGRFLIGVKKNVLSGKAESTGERKNAQF